MRTTKELAQDAYGLALKIAADPSTAKTERLVKLFAEAEAPRYPVVPHGVYGVVLVPADVFEKVYTTMAPLIETSKYLCANAAEVEHLKALGVDVPDEITFDYFKVLSAGV